MKFVLLAALVFGAAPSAFAVADGELDGGANIGLRVESNGSNYGTDGNTSTVISLNGTYGFFPSPHWEPQGSLLVRVNTGGGSTTTITPMGGVAYNFNEQTASSFYLGARVGPSFRSISSRNYSVLAWALFFGKRIALVDHVSWAPEVGVNGHTSGTTQDSLGVTWKLASYTEWDFLPLQIAVLF
jgi:hypothetical protein